MSNCKDLGQHTDPVHFNRGKHGHVWLCLACAKQLSGPSLPDDEKEALIEFSNYYRKQFKSREGINTANAAKGEKNMKLELAILAGAESKQFLVDFTKQIDRLEKLSGVGTTKAAPAKTKSTAPVDDEDVDTTSDTEDDEDFGAKKPSKTKKAAAAFEDDEEPAAEETEAEETASDDDDGFMAEEAPKKAAKAKKLTIDDVNDACKARAGRSNRAEVLGLLKKHFKTESVTKIDPKDYEKAIKIMNGK